MARKLGDYTLALHMRDVIEEITRKVINQQRPRQQYAKVVAIDRTNRRCSVQFVGDELAGVSVLIPMGTIQPARVGQTVRIVGTPDDRYIAEVIGPGDAYVAGSNVVSGGTQQTLYSPSIQPFTRTGVLSVATGQAPFRFPVPATLLGVTASLASAPSGTSVIADLNVNGFTTFTQQANRPTIFSGETSTRTETVPNIAAMSVGDMLTVDIDQVGNVVAGTTLTVYVRYIQLA